MENGGDGNSLSLMDVIAVDDNMLEDLDTGMRAGECGSVWGSASTPGERAIITLRYGLDDQPPRTQREVAAGAVSAGPMCPVSKTGPGKAGTGHGRMVSLVKKTMLKCHKEHSKTL